MWALQRRRRERPAQESHNRFWREPFVPYTLRHTALTKLGETAGGDVFVLARIAEHSSITVTQRYIHPQADAIHRVFAALQPQVVTKLGTLKATPKLDRGQELQRDTA
jgi:integrase